MSLNENTASTNADVQATPATKRVIAELGTVIHGTMRSQDLIPALIDRLDDLKQELALSAGDPENRGCELEITSRVGRIDTMLGFIESHLDEGDSYFESENAGWDIETLFDALDEFAPAGCYFGAHPGDGSDYGFWQGEPEETDSDDEEKSMLCHGGNTDKSMLMPGGCDQCQMLSINGTPCHESGCPNMSKVYEDGEWVKYFECRECGADVRQGECCDCSEVCE
jgi:hypothetical protein